VSSERSLRRIGREVLGPAYACFVHGAIERAESRGLERLAFVAREGQLFLRLYEVLASRLGRGSCHELPLPLAPLDGAAVGAPPGPRASCASPVRRVDRQERARPARGLRSRRRRADRAGARAPASRIPAIPCAATTSCGASRRLVEDAELQRLVAARAAVARARLRAYLAQEGIFRERAVGLIDIGWGGTIQDALERAFADDPAWPEVHGLYFGLGPSAYWRATARRAQGGARRRLRA
jgi:hypothetical protein